MADRFEQVLKNGTKLLKDILPKKSYLYFPLLFSTLFWLVKRRKDWKSKVMAWKVWADPGRIRLKPDAFILYFFDFNGKLGPEFGREVETNNMRALRKAFVALYPLIGLEDPFLCGLFHEELKKENYREIVRVYGTRIQQAKTDLSPAGTEKRIFDALGRIASEAADFLEELLGYTESRDAVAEVIKSLLEGREDGYAEPE
ncbi:MAG: hypothetical protein KKD56_04775 [Acidobacteria bacterium]|nr:hypothetical protein [Acidobacteriota bacterium]MCG2815299.1 hypothetical protein [Candidatus Aminicenantes bacterium]MBU1338362.1 hypothetical protein [Acidobacteriota bacterium]MBU1474980.1 hypothetical protein [Acidobacteriota bacterium]MBU2439218.1 hypothetical protein [Acidobacteriota bacterium]